MHRSGALIPALLATLAGFAWASESAATEPPLRLIDGIATGGPRLVASGMQWVVDHYSGAANRANFAEGPGRRLDYLLNLSGATASVCWAERIRLRSPGLVEASCLVLSDRSLERRAANVEVWFAEEGVARGAAAFSLGVDATTGALSQRARRDLNPDWVKELGEVTSLVGTVRPAQFGRRTKDGIETLPPQWMLGFSPGREATILAGQLRALRLGQLVGGRLLQATGPWACAVVSGFPKADRDAQAPAAYRAIRFTAPAGPRLILQQAYNGDPDQVLTLRLTVLHERPDGLAHASCELGWNGADWLVSAEQETVSPSPPVLLAGTPR